MGTRSNLTPRTLGMALVALGLAITHAATAEPTTPTGSKVSTFRPSGSSAGSSVITFNRSGGQAGRGVATVKGEANRYTAARPVRLAGASASRSKSAVGARGKVERTPPIIRVRRLDSDASAESLISGVQASLPEATPILLASADSSEGRLIAFEQPTLEVRADMLVPATPEEERQVVLADAAPIRITPLPVSGAPVAEEVLQEEAAKPVAPTITGGALGGPNRRR